MAKFVFRDKQFDSMSSYSFLEHEYESLLLEQADQLFPGLLVVPFAEPVAYEDSTRKADIALIDPGYRMWWVGEVELAHHSLNGHVLPQVEVLARGAYGARHVRALASKLPTLDSDRLTAMVRGAQPQVAVIVNEPVPGWTEPLARLDARLVVVEVFRSPIAAPAFRVNGDSLTVDDNVITACEVDSLLPNTLRVASPGALVDPQTKEVEILYRGSKTVWHVFRTSNVTYLMPARANPWSSGEEVRIVKTPDGQLAFESEGTGER